MSLAEFTKDVKAQARLTHWAFTLTEEYIDAVATTPRSGTRTVLDGAEVHLYVGPVEAEDDECRTSHRHCMISVIKDGCNKQARKGRVNAMICDLLKVEKFDDYLKPASSVQDYLRYCWKSTTSVNYACEQKILDTLHKMEQAQKAITLHRLKAAIVAEHGPHFWTKNKSVVETMAEHSDYYVKNPRNIPCIVNADENYRSAYRVANVFKRMLENNIKRTPVITTHAMEKCPNLPLLAWLIALLPTICNRYVQGDRLPALFLYGRPKTGKSYFFQSLPWYTKVAMDAQGVARYKMTGVQAAYLLDDMKAGFLDDTTNSGTLRALTTGQQTTVKVMGHTTEVQGWVVITSNDSPSFLSDMPADYKGNWEENCNAWMRRFLSIHCLNDLPDLDPIHVDWRHDSANEALMHFWLDQYQHLTDQEKAYFTVYYDFNLAKQDDNWGDRIGAFEEEENEWLNEAFTPVKRNPFAAMATTSRPKEATVEPIGMDQPAEEPAVPSAGPSKRNPFVVPHKTRIEVVLPCDWNCKCNKCLEYVPMSWADRKKMDEEWLARTERCEPHCGLNHKHKYKL
jgi:hypothetical protein